MQNIFLHFSIKMRLTKRDAYGISLNAVHPKTYLKSVLVLQCSSVAFEKVVRYIQGAKMLLSIYSHIYSLIFDNLLILIK